jgi:hypothetical protein
MNASKPKPRGGEVLSDPKFWDDFPGLLAVDNKVYFEFAATLGVSEADARARRREQLRRYLLKISPHMHDGNDTVH